MPKIIVVAFAVIFASIGVVFGIKKGEISSGFVAVAYFPISLYTLLHQGRVVGPKFEVIEAWVGDFVRFDDIMNRLFEEKIELEGEADLFLIIKNIGDKTGYLTVDKLRVIADNRIYECSNGELPWRIRLEPYAEEKKRFVFRFPAGIKNWENVELFMEGHYTAHKGKRRLFRKKEMTVTIKDSDL